MSAAKLKLLAVGPHCSVQDGGRFGLMRFGVPASGPMDRRAFALAHAALGNVPGAAGLEVSLGGITLECVEGAVAFAVAGGGFQVLLDGALLAPWCVAQLRPGVRLTIRPGPWGSWAALVFAGDLRAARWLGSAATHATSGRGGGPLGTGAAVMIDNARLCEDRLGAIEGGDLDPGNTEFRVVLGPQDRFFAADAVKDFLTQDFALTEAYDRMGVRLQGPILRPAAALDMPSEPILRGAIQVAGDGVATVLLADHQTTGGYPKIATILGCDLDRFSQLRAHDRVRFRAVTPVDAIVAARKGHAALQLDLTRVSLPKETLMQRLLSRNLIGGVVNASD